MDSKKTGPYIQPRNTPNAVLPVVWENKSCVGWHTANLNGYNSIVYDWVLLQSLGHGSKCLCSFPNTSRARNTYSWDLLDFYYPYEETLLNST